MASTIYGTIIHKGFYDLLTYTSSFIAGPRYEAIPAGSAPALVDSTPSPRMDNTGKKNKGRDTNYNVESDVIAARPRPTPPKSLKPGTKLTKDMVSRPAEFKHLVHASDADQAEALLRRWGPDNIGKLGDPRWAEPIKRIIRQQKTQKAVAEVVGGYGNNKGGGNERQDEGDRDYGYEEGIGNQYGKIKVQTKGEIEANILAQFQLLQLQNRTQPLPQLQQQQQQQQPSSFIQYPTPGPLRVINQITEPTMSSDFTISSTGATLRHDYDGGGVVDGLPQIQGGLSQTYPFSPTGTYNYGGYTGVVGGPGPGPRPSTLRIGGLETHFEERQQAQDQTLTQPPPLPQKIQQHAIKIPTLTTNPNTANVDELQNQIEESLSSSIHEIRSMPPSQSNTQTTPSPPRARPITPSLQTLEKAISCRIFFENLYFPLLRHPPSREQRRLAMEEDMIILGMSELQKERIREVWKRNETEYLRERRRRVGVNCFEKVKIVGHGAFGVVSLVREKQTGQLFAMKQLRKSDMLRKGQEGHVRAERDVLKSAALIGGAGADWIVKLFYSFQDSECLYLVLEFMGGGDLLNLLIAKDIFEEDFARFYVAEMILAIEQCHKHGFIHRDIKPDNFLFDPEGHIKLNYEQQRKGLLHRYGVDIADNDGAYNKTTRKLDKKEIEEIMGDGQGGGVFTWREKNRKKLAYSV
ncbi:hypothetical protein Clacol_000697 [Clathrus columnatus]|uniref:non-specific serine/threonine protein kinase n=1 Tax=Clathrus columnatus TaxID=1419009 RepID=A0AAV5A3N1_9AGAM|nr:hypothetical protein Clacol_000697 [Clathrus columnatus]